MSFNDMPPLVDNPGYSPFIPPPQGASNGGQPGNYPPFSASHPNWPVNATPYPAFQTQLPNWPVSQNDPPASAHSWTYGNYQPITSPTWGPPQPQAPAWGQTSTDSWGVPRTPGGTWGAPSPASYGPPQTPYPSWPQQPQQPPPQPNVPIDSTFGQPITAGWFGAGKGNEGVRSGAPIDSTFGQPIAAGWFGAGKGNEEVRSGRPKKKTHSSMRRSNSHGPPNRRSNSQGPPNRQPLLQRTATRSGGDFQYPYYADSFDAQNLARRPLDWRPDFDARAGFASYIPRVGKTRTDVEDYSDPIRRTLHPLLLHVPNQPPVYHDLRDHPLALEYIDFRNLHRDHNDIDFAQLVLQPTSAFMRLFHPRLPWYIDIHQSHPNGVTVYDVFSQMNQQLHRPIQGKHYWNEDLGESDRSTISAAYQARCKGDPRQITTGVLRVDFLGRKPIFEGLSRGSRGLWEIKTAKA